MLRLWFNLLESLSILFGRSDFTCVYYHYDNRSKVLNYWWLCNFSTAIQAFIRKIYVHSLGLDGFCKGGNCHGLGASLVVRCAKGKKKPFKLQMLTVYSIFIHFHIHAYIYTICKCFSKSTKIAHPTALVLNLYRTGPPPKWWRSEGLHSAYTVHM